MNGTKSSSVAPSSIRDRATFVPVGIELEREVLLGRDMGCLESVWRNKAVLGS